MTAFYFFKHTQRKKSQPPGGPDNAKTAAAHTAVPATKIERGEMKKVGIKFIKTVRLSDWKRFHFIAGCPALFYLMAL